MTKYFIDQIFNSDTYVNNIGKDTMPKWEFSKKKNSFIGLSKLKFLNAPHENCSVTVKPTQRERINEHEKNK